MDTQTFEELAGRALAEIEMVYNEHGIRGLFAWTFTIGVVTLMLADGSRTPAISFVGGVYGAALVYRMSTWDMLERHAQRVALSIGVPSAIGIAVIATGQLLLTG